MAEVETQKEYITIKNWPEDDRPREKFISKGRSQLSDAELLAILIGSGSRNESAVSLSRRVLESVNANLNTLGKLELKEFKKFKGIGPVKAITILSALELGRRRKEQAPEKKVKITGSRAAYEYLYPYLSDLHHEEFNVLLLNRANEIITIRNISKGGTTGTVVDIKIIMKSAIDTPGCCGIILAHNHPSGQIKPSDADIKITAKVKEIASFMDINLLDHIIMGDDRYFSFADEGMM